MTWYTQRRGGPGGEIWTTTASGPLLRDADPVTIGLALLAAHPDADRVTVHSGDSGRAIVGRAQLDARRRGGMAWLPAALDALPLPVRVRLDRLAQEPTP